MRGRAPATVKVVHGGLELQRGAPVVHDGIVHAVEVRLNDEDQLVGDEQVALLPLRPARAGGLPVLRGDPRACERKCPGVRQSATATVWLRVLWAWAGRTQIDSLLLAEPWGHEQPIERHPQRILIVSPPPGPAEGPHKLPQQQKHSDIAPHCLLVILRQPLA